MRPIVSNAGPALIELITDGGDERTELDPDRKTNKYGLNPVDYRGLLNRGSCTGSPLNAFSEKKVRKLIDQDLPSKGFAAIRNEHEQRLKALLNYPEEDKFDIFWAPSGSDLIYLPFLLAQLLYPQRPLLHMLTCPEELGSGTKVGASGQYFMEYNQFGEVMPKGTLLAPELDLKIVHYPARSKTGLINNHRDDIKDTIRRHPRHAKIGSLVIGSKSGIENNVDVINEVEEDMLWVVDLCQFRNSKRLINKLLDRNCMIMLTGSKFYQAPPFCGAMLIPRQLIDRLQQAEDQPDLSAYRRLFTFYDFPKCLPRLRQGLRPFENTGLLARWEAGIAEMEAFDRIPREDRNKLVSDWNALISREISQRPDSFELMPNQDQTNNSIISFRVKKSGAFLNNGRLRAFFHDLVTGHYPGHFAGDYDRVFIGQPVNYGDRSFIRLALGAYDIRQMLKAEQPFANELALLDLIAEKLS
jgi:hypothetical protein